VEIDAVQEISTPPKTMPHENEEKNSAAVVPLKRE
jgi:hypothetical protein